MSKTMFTSNWAIYQTYLGSRRGLLSDDIFYSVLSEAVDEALSAVIGDAGRQALYFRLRVSYGIKKGDVPFKVEQFAQAVEDIFGEGARLIEIEILKRLYKKASAHVKLGRFENFLNGDLDLTFTGYISALKQLYNCAQRKR
ncbi:MAG: hypothetical protein ACUVUE_07420 [Candidatus Bathycorpusculaceae bacterium]